MPPPLRGSVFLDAFTSAAKRLIIIGLLDALIPAKDNRGASICNGSCICEYTLADSLCIILRDVALLAQINTHEHFYLSLYDLLLVVSRDPNEEIQEAHPTASRCSPGCDSAERDAKHCSHNYNAAYTSDIGETVSRCERSIGSREGLRLSVSVVWLDGIVRQSKGCLLQSLIAVLSVVHPKFFFSIHF